MDETIATTAQRLVRELDGPEAELVRATVDPIAHRVIRETTASLSRVTVHLRRAPTAETTARTFVVKCMRADAPVAPLHREKFLPSAIPTHPNYWRREFEAYGSPLLGELTVPLRAPILYERELGARTATLWLEDAASVSAAAWSDERFYAIARALGHWQGASIARVRSGEVPSWLARGSLQMWAPAVGGSAFAAAHRDGVLNSSRASRALGAHGGDGVRSVWRERDATLAELERAPHAFTHGDFWTRNVLAHEDAHASIVAIDWSEFGIAPLAHDLVNLVLDSIWMFDVPAMRLQAIERAAIAGYDEGWEEGAGVNAGADIVRAYRASARLRFASLAGPLLVQATDDRKRDDLSVRYARSFDDIFDTRAAVIRAALSSP